MAKPIIRGIPAFDAALGYGISELVEISYSGQASKNRVYVYDAASNTIIKNGSSEYTEHNGLYFIIEANKLTNGKSYYACVEAVDASGNASEKSDYVFFDCYSTPTFVFSNVNNNDLVENSFLEATLSYSQEQDRDLLSYIFYLYEVGYDGSNRETSSLIYTSDTYYDTTMSCLYRGLEPNQKYDIRAVGSTVDNMVVDTGMIRIRVAYVRPDGDYYVLSVKNIPTCGWIEYKTNIRIVDAEFWEKKDPNAEIPDTIFENDTQRSQYYTKVEEKDVDGDSVIDCTNGVIIYNKVWSVLGDFMLRANFRELKASSTNPFIVMYNRDTLSWIKVYLLYYEEDEYAFMRFKMVVNSSTYGDHLQYIRYTDEFVVDSNVPISGSFEMNRINDLYYCTAFNLTEANVGG